LQLDALASGSSGNSYLLRSGETAVLIEAGLSASKLASYLIALGLDPRLLRGILLTHAHGDHLLGARELSDRYRVPLYATAGTLGHITLRDSAMAHALEAGRAMELGELEVLPFRVPHDCRDPIGFRISGDGATVSLTTDLGFVPDRIRPHLEAADLLVLEANHDEQMLWSGPYPSYLKRRVGGRNGHLSNLAAARCVLRLARRPPREVWLAHLSLVNNRVSRAIETVNGVLKAAGLGYIPVLAAGRNRPSLRWQSKPAPRQLSLF
jgi:phosphoribosyl 1,2-cyclic phosphodiesterase